ncbi:uncharacterized protein MELLADRAFT_101291 [Melampsora larici-populina 98AG31]|uniref:Uncharacterized protein n=1 Tax=Melampsora larici-populina (strain 98AG31 / pathotype 3-4-7) TaxID=747676 RepID=F4R493_MELLP|nr:uncharacterized protein MELLADRAFT_101291 [Melampsora larici-populina 98AG31]EGG13038.1 hypothetical protein MELLADRAFT_101291 [Melampsora larici-populina 98AG31]
MRCEEISSQVSGSAKKHGSSMNAANRIELAQMTVTKACLRSTNTRLSSRKDAWIGLLRLTTHCSHQQGRAELGERWETAVGTPQPLHTVIAVTERRYSLKRNSVMIRWRRLTSGVVRLYEVTASIFKTFQGSPWKDMEKRNHDEDLKTPPKEPVTSLTAFGGISLMVKPAHLHMSPGILRRSAHGKEYKNPGRAKWSGEHTLLCCYICTPSIFHDITISVSKEYSRVNGGSVMV